MKKHLLATVALVALVVTSFAQKQLKLGYVNSMEVLSLMPEVAKADTALSKYQKELNDLGTKMYAEYQAKSQDAQAKKAKNLLTPEMEELVVQELGDMEKRIDEFSQNAEQKLGNKKEMLYNPIMTKVSDAIKTVSKANGYTYVFDVSQGSILFVEESENILPLLKTYMKLPDPKPVAAPKPLGTK